MVSITPQFFYGFSPTTSSPHVTAITTFHESAITLLRSKSSIITLRLSTNTIFVFMHEKKYLHEFYVLLSATYLSKHLRNAVSDIYSSHHGMLSPKYIQVHAGCCLRYNLDFILKYISSLDQAYISSAPEHAI